MKSRKKEKPASFWEDELEELEGTGNHSIRFDTSVDHKAAESVAPSVPELRVEGFNSSVECLDLFEDRTLFSGYADGLARCWNLFTMKCDVTFKGHSDGITALKAIRLLPNSKSLTFTPLRSEILKGNHFIVAFQCDY